MANLVKMILELNQWHIIYPLQVEVHQIIPLVQDLEGEKILGLLQKVRQTEHHLWVETLAQLLEYKQFLIFCSRAQIISCLAHIRV